ncbi:PEP-CTERM sorting domain-containing protein [Myxococcota bacterium]|nr:PEP-CTERM sorting domain-containing protein [Myxococcota bacterium]
MRGSAREREKWWVQALSSFGVKALSIAVGLLCAEVGPSLASPLWLSDEAVHVGIDPTSDDGIFQWQLGESSVDTRIWWWLEVDGRTARSLDQFDLEVDRDEEWVEIEREARRGLEFENNLMLVSGDEAGSEAILLQVLEVENEWRRRDLSVRVLLLADLRLGPEIPVEVGAIEDPVSRVLTTGGGLTLDTRFTLVPNRLSIGEPERLIADFLSPIAGENSNRFPVLHQAWAAEWWFELGPGDEAEFSVGMSLAPEPSSSLLLAVGLAVLANRSRRYRSVV